MGNHRLQCGKKVLSRVSKRDRNWIEKNTVGCPKCGFCYEKSEGCNHMICSKCQPPVHFCYLCGSGLDPRKYFLHV